ncbi:MAG TPA: chorismate-binding protein [Acidimicrobiia bacterium]|jgi:para-aminobenzoate synthetase/4-amino-4-deoxychorismate lyase
MFPRARFDDHSASHEHAFALTGLQDTVVAGRLDEVLPALRRVEEASRAGMWACGFVAYEAAGAFDAGLATVDRQPGDPFAELPLVWFAIFEQREPFEPLAPRPGGPPRYNMSAWRPDVTRDEYYEAIARIKQHLVDGDTNQVNHTFRLRAAFAGDPDELYRDIALAQRGAYSGNFDLGRYRVLSASPECFFRVEDGTIRTRPMKGTIRRGRWPGEDDEMARRLAESDKDMAENLMIVDLLRSDLGRIARTGTVRADELFAIERFETLWQMTSGVSAELDADASLVDVFGALFPSASVTGTPKRRTMEIITSLEGSPRGVYAGAFGYIAPMADGGVDAEFNVAIRTVTIDLEEGVAEYGVGGGITWGSTAGSEYEEAKLKARLLVERRPEFDLLETMRWTERDGFVLIDRHMARLAATARYFGFAIDPDLVLEVLEKELDGATGEQYVRMTLARGGELFVERPSPLLEPFCSEPPGAATLHVAVAERPIHSESVFLFHKTTNRKAYDIRAAEHPIADDVILVNERGEITELTTASLMVEIGGEWWTPGLDSGCLPGVYRDELLEEGVCRERAISRRDLADAGRLAAVNSVRGWRKVELLGPP